VQDLAGGKRAFNLTVDASVINAHTPAFASANGYDGIAFDNLIGMWFHQFNSLSTSYANGRITQWTANGGWMDGSNRQTTLLVPLPAGAWLGLAGLAGVGYVARKRRTALQA
jgi:hypothetical protein